MTSWLLLHKQTHHWGAVSATADACYAILRQSGDQKGNRKLNIRMGPVSITNTTGMDNNGYTSKVFTGNTIRADLGKITINTQTDSAAGKRQASWGAVYWQYLEDMDQLTATAAPMQVEKKLFIEKKTANGTILEPLAPGKEPVTGDMIVVRMTLRVDRDLEYVQLKDLRAAGTEPAEVFSGYRWQDGLGYYQTISDISTQFFFNRLNKGVYIFDYKLKASQVGIFSAGIATMQCLYAPAYSNHSGNTVIRINKPAQ